jgi:hypothetical protein
MIWSTSPCQLGLKIIRWGEHGMRVYLSYRRHDSLGWPKMLADVLRKRFSEANVFESGAPGASTSHNALISRVSQCDVLLAIIGPAWEGEHGADINDPNDPVRLELATAVARGLRVLAIRVGGARMPDPRSLPEDIRPLARSQAPELTTLTWNTVVRDLVSGLDPDRRRRWQQRIIDISLAAVTAVLITAGTIYLLYPAQPTLDDLWSNIIFPIEFGAPTRHYFDRDYGNMDETPEYNGNPRDAHWDSKDAKPFLDLYPPWKDFMCVSAKDQVTFIFSENKLVRVSFRFCDGVDPCHARRFPFFSALARQKPHVNGNEKHFEAEGKAVDMLGWTGPGLTAVDLVKKSDHRFEGEKWFAFLREIVLENQCRR